MKMWFTVLLVVLASIGSTTLGDNTRIMNQVTSNVREVRPGVFVTNDAGALPLPTSGYHGYVLGEMHGVHEIHLLFLDYLCMLHEDAALCDIVLEAPQADERAINEYVLGFNNRLPYPYSYFTEILQAVRALNKTCYQDEKIRVHLVDLDFHLSQIHNHLHILQQEVDPAAHVVIPPLDEFERLSRSDMGAFVDQLTEVTDNDSVVNELETVRASIQHFFEAVGGIKRQLREERIAQNIQYVLTHVDTPVLALYGGWHAQKCEATLGGYQIQPWTQKLIESGTCIYSCYAMGISGDIWDGRMKSIYKNPGHIQFPDGSTLADIVDTLPGYNIFYIDLRRTVNAATRLGSNTEVIGFFDPTIAGSKIYDGLIVFRKVTPLWPGELIQEADSLVEQGKEEFKKGNYETALTFFQKAREKYKSVDSEKALECDEWIEKTETELNGFCLGTILVVLVFVGIFIRYK